MLNIWFKENMEIFTIYTYIRISARLIVMSSISIIGVIDQNRRFLSCYSSVKQLGVRLTLDELEIEIDTGN